MPVPIADLKNQMIDIDNQGYVRQKTDIRSFQNKKGSFFTFFVYDTDGSSIRFIAYNECAETRFREIENGKT